MAETSLEIVSGSVLDQNVDAVVNAANEGMRGGGGIDGAIHSAAGPELLAALKQAAPQGARTGTAVLTGGYRLAQPYIIHTPGPRWRGGQSGEPDHLASSYRACLEAAAQKGLKTIAFCSISTGVCGYPLAQAAPLALRTVQDYLESHPDSSLERVVFALYGDAEYQAFVAAWAQIAGQ